MCPTSQCHLFKGTFFSTSSFPTDVVEYAPGLSFIKDVQPDLKTDEKITPPNFFAPTVYLLYVAAEFCYKPAALIRESEFSSSVSEKCLPLTTLLRHIVNSSLTR